MSSSAISEESTETLTSAKELLTMLGTELLHAEKEYLCILSFENVNNLKLNAYLYQQSSVVAVNKKDV